MQNAGLATVLAGKHFPLLPEAAIAAAISCVWHSVSGALLAGKISTAVLFVSLIAMVLFPMLDYRVIQIITVIDCIVLLASFIGYARLYYTHSPMIQELPDDEKNDKTSG